MTNTFNYGKIYNELISYIPDEFINDYDIDGVMDELRDNNVQSLDDIDIDSILMEWDKTE